MQYSYFPWTKVPEESTSVAHQGESPSMVVQVVCFRPAKVNGKTQFPHVPDPDPGAELDVVGGVVVVVYHGTAVVELTFADSHGTAAASSLSEGGSEQVLNSVI